MIFESNIQLYVDGQQRNPDSLRLYLANRASNIESGTVKLRVKLRKNTQKTIVNTLIQIICFRFCLLCRIC